MKNLELMTLICNNLPDSIKNIIQTISGTLIAAIFLRNNTSTVEFEKIKAGKFGEAIDDLLKSGTMTYTEYYKVNNFLSIAKKADKYYLNRKINENSINEYDFDWFMRFYETVGNISDEEMQDLWARILAGEINNPNKFSLKTFDVLKNINKKDAELFNKVLKFSIRYKNNYFLPRYDNFLRNANICYSDIMRLSELDLIYNDGSIIMNITSTQERKILFTNKELLLSHSVQNESTKFVIKQYPFTYVGNELASIIDINISNEDFIKFGNEIKNANNSILIEAHKIIYNNGNSYGFDSIDMLG